MEKQDGKIYTRQIQREQILKPDSYIKVWYRDFKTKTIISDRKGHYIKRLNSLEIYNSKLYAFDKIASKCGRFTKRNNKQIHHHGVRT